MSQTRLDPESESNTYKTPFWVKIFGIILIVIFLVILVVVVVFEPSGGHGPQLHIPASNTLSSESGSQLPSIEHDGQ